MEENTRSNKKKNTIIVAVIVAVLILIGGSLWYAIHNGYISISGKFSKGAIKETAKELTVAATDVERNTNNSEEEIDLSTEEVSESEIESDDSVNPDSDTTTVEKSSEDSDDSILSSIEESKKAESIKAAQAENEASQKFESVSDVVTAKQKTNLRTTPNQENDDNIVASIEHGEQVNRTGISINGWSQIEYEGQTLYAVSSYLMDPEESLADANKPTEATQRQLDFAVVDEMVTAKIETNLRRVPSTKNDEDVVVMIKNGETVRRTGIATNGWSRVEYEGQTLYAVSSLLTVVED